MSSVSALPPGLPAVTRLLDAGFIGLTAVQPDAVRDPWIVADGRAVSRTTYSALIRAIGTQFGVGDDSTTFNVPDLMGRFIQGTPVGSAANIVTGQMTTVVLENDLVGSTWNLNRVYLTPIILAR